MSKPTGDLISRSKMIEDINNHINKIVDKDVKKVYEAFIDFINQQPTVYETGGAEMPPHWKQNVMERFERVK